MSKKSVIGRTLEENAVFFLLYTTLSLFLLGCLFLYGNSALFLLVNANHSPIADQVFFYGTYLGDGVVAFLLVVALLRISFRDAITFLVITLLITIIINIMKNQIFPDFDRPVRYFGSTRVLHLVPGYTPPTLCTFPSGHTATVFSISTYLAFLFKGRFVKILLLFVALFVGYTRIYLSSHFPADVLGGAFIGVSVTLLCYCYSRSVQRTKSTWLDRNLVFPNRLYVEQSTY